eukprot:5847741-Lingulodinium_polyedra.AAC.1
MAPARSAATEAVAKARSLLPDTHHTRLRDISGTPVERDDLAPSGFDDALRVPSYALLNALAGP